MNVFLSHYTVSQLLSCTVGMQSEMHSLRPIYLSKLSDRVGEDTTPFILNETLNY